MSSIFTCIYSLVPAVKCKMLQISFGPLMAHNDKSQASLCSFEYPTVTLSLLKVTKKFGQCFVK